ncbi:hypothetical protein IW261DRAFT_1626990, partial [Armillaria novae-zelandiae]
QYSALVCDTFTACLFWPIPAGLVVYCRRRASNSSFFSSSADSRVRISLSVLSLSFFDATSTFFLLTSAFLDSNNLCAAAVANCDAFIRASRSSASKSSSIDALKPRENRVQHVVSNSVKVVIEKGSELHNRIRWPAFAMHRHVPWTLSVCDDK